MEFKGMCAFLKDWSKWILRFSKRLEGRKEISK